MNKPATNFSQFFEDLDKCLDRLLRNEVFLPLGLELMKRKVIFTENVPLGAPAATDHNFIFVNPKSPFFSPKFLPKFMFAMLHEIFHIILKHNVRMGHRDHKLWWFATDFMINLFLLNLENERKNLDPNNLICMNIQEYANTILLSQEFENMIEEEIYEVLKKESKSSSKSSTINYKKFLEECGVPNDNVDPNAEIKVTENTLQFRGKTYKDIGVEFPEPIHSQDEIDKQGTISEEDLSKAMFEQRIMSRGLDNQKFSKFLGKLFKVKVDWIVILRDSLLIELQKSPEVSFNRPRLAWLANAHYLPYLPNQDMEEKYGTLIITIDESGSMSDEDIIKAIDIVRQADSYYKNIYVIKHDTTPNWYRLYEKINDDDIAELLERRACGGTSHEEVFKHIVDFSRNQDTYVSLVLCITDMCSDLPESQKILGNIPRMYLLPQETRMDTTDIKGKVIVIK